MATQEFIFRGKAKFLQYLRQSKYEDYRVQFFPATDEIRRSIRDTGTKCGVKEDDGKKWGEPSGFYYTFTNKQQFPVTDDEGNAITVPVGNGSDISIRLTVEDFMSQYGPNSRTQLVGVVVHNLIPYEKKEEKAKLPT